MAKRRKHNDPHYNREAKKYEHPVPSREYICKYLEDAACPVSLNHLLTAFEIHSEHEHEGLRRRLKAMIRDGQLMSNRRNSYVLVDKVNLVPGRVLANRDGSGFLQPDDGSQDIFLPAREMRSVFNNDRVLVGIARIGSRGRREGSIVEVVERNTHQVVGRFFKEDGIAFVDPDNKLITQDIIIPPEHQADAEPGQFVVAEIMVQPRQRRQPTGKIVEVLGDQLTPGMEMELAIRSHELPYIWPQAAIDEAQAMSSQLQDKDYEGREDLRKLPFVTIDGSDAKDFDDAVYCEPVTTAQKDGAGKKAAWRLFVAIADVSHYVQPDSALDREAKLRGNSVYFPNRVIPMLPEILSNGLCSLNPKQDRCVLVCEMQLTDKGELLDYAFKSAVMHSCARLTYGKVAKMLENPQAMAQTEFTHSLSELFKLYKQLIRRKKVRGAIEFNSTETQVLFGKQGKIDRIVPLIRNDAHRLIEECMLEANACTADFIGRNDIPALYRVHDGPDEERLLGLRDFLKPFGLRLAGGKKPTPKDYNKLLERINKRDDAPLLQLVLLRSLRQAVYSPDNIGHFGLAYEGYTHFTSPIRRYPDLMVHRTIKHILSKQKVDAFIYDHAAVSALGKQCSVSERRADLATRDALDWLKCDYMQDKVGQEFSGTICDVTSFGIFVQLKDVYVQGLVHITALRNDYYHYDPVHHLLRGRRSGQVYRLSDPVKILVARVDLDQRQIDFELAKD